MANRIIRLILCYIGGVIFAFALGEGVWYLCFLPESLFDVCLVYVPTVLYLIIFLTYPLAGTLGIHFVDKLIYKLPTHHRVWRIVAGFLMGLFSIVLILKILPFWGIGVIEWVQPIFGIRVDLYLLPFIASLFALIGYNSIAVFRCFIHKSQNATH